MHYYEKLKLEQTQGIEDNETGKINVGVKRYTALDGKDIEVETFRSVINGEPETMKDFVE
jgi:hypothetical protein